MAVVIVIDSQQLWQCEAGYARLHLERLLHFDQLHRRSVLRWMLALVLAGSGLPVAQLAIEGRKPGAQPKGKGPTLANCGPGWGTLEVHASLRR